MNCKNCGTENPDEAVFCKSCGKRLDGMTICPACGKQIAGDSAFCNYCGKRIAAPQAQVEVPLTSPVQAAYVPVSPEAVQQRKAAQAATAQKVLKYIATSAVLATAVFALIFVFLMGLTATASVSGIGGASSTMYLYYYFGEGYELLDKAFESLNTSDFFSVCIITPIVFGTIISAVTLIVVTICSVCAIVFSIRNLLGKSQGNGAGCALTAFITFVTGSLLLLSINNASMNVNIGGFSITSISSNVVYSLNGGTIAGIVLCSVFAAAYVGCSIASQGKALLNDKSIVKIILSLVSVILIVVIMALASLPAYGLKKESMSYVEHANLGIMHIIALLGTMCMDKVSNFKLGQISGVVYTLAFFAFIFLAVLAMLAAGLLIRNVSGAVNKGNKKSGLALSIVVTLFAVLYLVFSIVAVQELLRAAEQASGGSSGSSSSSEVTFTYAVPIVMLVISLLALGVNIAQFCIAHTSNNKPAPAPQPAPVQNV